MASDKSTPGVGPAFMGYIDSTVSALRIVRAAMEGIVPRTSRRLTSSERQAQIISGAVFVFSVQESGIKRWTDGMLWSPSRIQGNFLIYKELEKKAVGRSSPQKNADDDGESPAPDFMSTSSSEPCSFKVSGLLKKTITISVRDSDFHLVSYFRKDDVNTGVLLTPRARLDLMALPLSPRDFQLEKLRNPPKTERRQDGESYIKEETEELSLEGSDTPRTSNATWEPEGSGRYDIPPYSHLPNIASLQLGTDLPSLGPQQGQVNRTDLQRRTTAYPPRRHTFDTSPNAITLPSLTPPAQSMYSDTSPMQHRSLETLGLRASPSIASNFGHSPSWDEASHGRSSPHRLISSPHRQQRQQQRQLSPLRGMRPDRVNIATPTEFDDATENVRGREERYSSQPMNEEGSLATAMIPTYGSRPAKVFTSAEATSTRASNSYIPSSSRSQNTFTSAAAASYPAFDPYNQQWSHPSSSSARVSSSNSRETVESYSGSRQAIDAYQAEPVSSYAPTGVPQRAPTGGMSNRDLPDTSDFQYGWQSFSRPSGGA